VAELRVREIYRSIQGESTWAGWPCVFVRTAGCDIRCSYCDEPHALTAVGSEKLTVDEVLERVAALDTRMVEVTGGEPLLQSAVPELVTRFCDAGYTVLIETGGHHDISVLDPRSHAIVDVKTPGSHMRAHNDLANLARLRAGDELKFVLCDRADYDWAVALVRERKLEGGVPVNFSPVHPGLDPAELAGWIQADGLRVRLNLQLHKYIWGADTKGV
jgi:7-carboxy-7-deazaguanine synthase